MMNNKTIEYYLDLPYTIEFQQDKSDPQHPVWFAKVKELPGCMTEADTLEEAAEMIQDAMAVWIQGSLDAGLAIPEPHSESDYSGKFSVRLPKSLHRDLVEVAEREGVSLNQYINVMLSRAIGSH
jgi:antitoxin HicB